MIDGRLYLNTQLNQVVALNADTGTQIWSFDPAVYQLGYPAGLGFYQRGVAYWQSPTQANKKRIYAQTNSGLLYALDANTGNLDAHFGNEGMLDLKLGLSKPAMRDTYGQTSPALVCGKT